MSNIPNHLKYTAEHEWIRDEGDNIMCIGITDYAQLQLGDLVFVELPNVGVVLERGAMCAVVESVKSASDVYAPLTGEVIEVNNSLENSPELINQDPYDAGWMFRMRHDDSSEIDELLDSAGYAELIAQEVS